LSQNTLIYTLAAKDLNDLLQQRKRWAVGLRKIPFYYMIILLVQSNYLILVLLLFLINPYWGLMALGIKLLTRSTFLALMLRRIGVKISWISVICYEPYQLLISFWTFLCIILPLEIKWKGRRYTRAN